MDPWPTVQAQMPEPWKTWLANSCVFYVEQYHTALVSFEDDLRARVGLEVYTFCLAYIRMCYPECRNVALIRPSVSRVLAEEGWKVTRAVGKGIAKDSIEAILPEQ